MDLLDICMHTMTFLYEKGTISLQNMLGVSRELHNYNFIRILECFFKIHFSNDRYQIFSFV